MPTKISLAAPAELLAFARLYQGAFQDQQKASEGVLRRLLRHAADCALLDLVQAGQGTGCEIAVLAARIYSAQRMREAIRLSRAITLPGMEKITQDRLAALLHREDQDRARFFGLLGA